jgi:hypothetical protein
MKVIQDNIQRDVEAQYKNQLNAQKAGELNLQQQNQLRADFYADMAMHGHIVLGQLQSAAALAQGPAALAQAKFAADQIQAGIEVAKRQSADANSRFRASAKTADDFAKWNYNNAQAGAGAAGAGVPDKPLMDKVTQLNLSAGALDKVINEADSRKGGETPGAAAGIGEALSYLPGTPTYRGGSDWNLTIKLATGELGKLAKGGVGSEGEVASLLEEAPGQNASVERKQLYLDKLRRYVHGLKQNMNDVFRRQGHASFLPYPEAEQNAGSLATDSKK